jgi:hypothetical protein
LLNSISSLAIVHSKDFFNFKYLKDKKLSNIVLVLSSITCLIIALYQFSVLYLFLLADLLCCACVYVIFKGLYKKKVYIYRSLFLIISGLCSGLLFFPTIDLSGSLLVGYLFNKDSFDQIFTNSLLFWSFLFSFFVPLIIDFFISLYGIVLKKLINT